MAGTLASLSFQMVVNRGEVPFHDNIINNFMFIKTELKLIVHPENSEWFSIIYVVIFEGNIVAEQKQAYWWRFFVFYEFP